MTARTDFLAGARTIIPALVGIVPFATIVGLAAVDIGLSPVQAVSLSVAVFAGASQLAAIDLLSRNAPVTVILLTVVIINVRFAMYSASIAPYLRRFGGPAKFVGGYVLTDMAYAVSVAEFHETTPEERSRLWYYLGTAVTIWAAWQAATAVGAILGSALPADLSLEFAIPLTFMALLFKTTEDRHTWVAAVVAGSVGIVASALPFNLGLVTSAVVGIAVGVVLDIRSGEFPRVDESGPSREINDGSPSEPEDPS